MAQATWRKYPNPMNPNVVAIDVLDREVKNGVLHSHRLLSSKWIFPGWAKKVIHLLSMVTHGQHFFSDFGQ